MIDISWLILVIPMASAAVLLLAGRRSNAWGHYLGVSASAGAFVVGVLMFAQLLGEPAAERVHDVHLFTWIPAGPLTVDAGLRVDPLSMTFVLLITFVGTLIHIYSIGYMQNDKDKRRFFAYLNLFIAAMLILVLGNSYALLFLGWEGVGLASYLLIGFWNQHTEFAVAAKKAFVMNRVGDMGLIVAMGLLFTQVGSLSYADVDSAIGDGALGAGWAVAAGLCLLLAATGKSAQFPLQAWLGDAMAGPTPVSALIHAATMVTAGVYLVVRSHLLFEAAPLAQVLVAAVGAFTLLLGAFIACAKDDIKKSLAGSTMSQVGYMVLGAGLGPIGYAFAIFHMLTHGFFKAGLFLGAGSVMHENDDSTNMRTFGRLWKFMPITWLTFAACWLAIMGVPPFAGFFSKDKIIEAAFAGTGWQPWVFGMAAMIGAGVTAYYMTRMFFMTFHGKARWVDPAEKLGEDDPRPRRHPHEAPLTMTIPMIVLGAGAVCLGFILAISSRIETWLAPVVGESELHHHELVLPQPVIMTITLVLVGLGILAGVWQFGVRPVPATPPHSIALVRAARRDFYADDVNEALTMKPGLHLANTLAYADEAVIDGAVRATAAGTHGSGRVLRLVQNGYVRSYAAMTVFGIVAAGVVIQIVRF